MRLRTKGPLDLLVARHGESEGNRRGIVQGLADWPLSPKGREQAALLADRVRETFPALVAIYSSPLSRARETAEILRRRFENLSLRILPALREIHVGRLTGRPLEEMRRSDPLLARTLETGASIADWDPEAESYEESHRRARGLLARLLKRHAEGGAILLVTHAGFALHLAKALLGIAPSRRVFFPRRNASLAHFHVAGEAVHVRELASTVHLPDGALDVVGDRFWGRGDGPASRG